MVLKPGGWTTGLEEDKIAGFSSWMCGVPDSPTGLRGIEYRVLKRMLYFAPRRFEGLINYKDLKLTSVFAPEQLWFGKR